MNEDELDLMIGRLSGGIIHVADEIHNLRNLARKFADPKNWEILADENDQTLFRWVGTGDPTEIATKVLRGRDE